MHEYDIALKSILTRPSATALTRLTGFEITSWFNAELPEVLTRRADLLGATSRPGLGHVELQSTNDVRMALRMLEYSTSIYRGYGEFPEQAVLYVGNAPLKMNGRLTGHALTFECPIIDIRELDSEPLLASRSLDDNIVAILTRLADERTAVRRILERIAENDPARRAAAVTELMILAGLRNLGTVIEREIEQMPILNDIMDHEVIGRERKYGWAEGERFLVMSQIGKRFGPIPAWARQRVEGLSAPELEKVALRLLDAASLEDLLT